MKKVNVIVKEKTLLELAEDANKGDLIDLKEIATVDTSYLDMIIESGKDKVYESKLEDVKKALNAENNLKLEELKNQIDSLNKDHASQIKLKEQEIDKLYSDKIADLKNQITKLNEEKSHELDNLKNEKQAEIQRLNNQIDSLKNDNQKALTIKEQEVAKAFNDTIADLKKEIELLKQSKKSDIETINSKNEADKNKIIADNNQKYSELEQKYNIIMSQFENRVNQVKLETEAAFNKKISEIETQNKLALADKDAIIQKKDSDFELEKIKLLAEQKDKYEETIREKEDTINNLQRAKASMNVKQTGEDLEAWCDNEVSSYMQNGLLNCTWTKDNKVVREEDESKGSKADYIFKVYASNKHEESELLTSVCMDMKDENPDSVNKKSNSDYYKALDKNREKKNCKYALLVSNLEMDKPNVLPIFKVREYENMYVVRPAYLMTFLNMIASLTTRFAELILSKEVEMLELKTKLDLLEEFEDIKKTYLDKPLESLEKSIESITKSSETIKNACKSIDEQCDKINRSYITQITEKINKYELKLNRGIVKKLQE